MVVEVVLTICPKIESDSGCGIDKWNSGSDIDKPT